MLTGAGVYIYALIIAFLYTSSQDDRGQMTTYYIVTVPAQWMPYLVLLMTWLTAGTSALKIGLCGLVAAHLHDFLTRLWPEFGGGNNLLPTPRFIRRMWETIQTTVQHKPHGTSITPAQRSQAEDTSSGPLPDSWKSRGSGHRLG
jgi:Derlin-2/3